MQPSLTPAPQIQVGLGLLPDGQTIVVLAIPVAGGGAMSWQIDPTVAENLGAALVQQARQARSGLIVPPGASMPLPQAAPNGKAG